MWVGDGDQFCRGGDRGLQLVDIELKAFLEGECDGAECRADGPWCFDIGGIVGVHHDEFVAFVQQGGGNDKKRARRTDGEQDVFGVQAAAGGCECVVFRQSAMVDDQRS